MKKKLITMAAATLLFATGCGADNEESRGQEGTLNQNIEPVRYQNHPDNNRNYTLQRDLEEPNNYQGTRNYHSPEQVRYSKDDRNDKEGETNRYDVAEEAADLIVEKMDVIDNAYVITTDNNAYVAAELDTNNNNGNNKGNKLTDDVKKRISEIVQSVDNSIENVYVSTNPDFLNLANNYADDIDNGEPIEGFFEEFGNMIERIFPQNR
ncbi:YhcN/YlaJ family sporulation lipoprotein [Ornithinibacillus halotolerans]|nr:YhcN/YlaJ family sporulation lipoprotein [Ornithinibacillus halotolerans]